MIDLLHRRLDEERQSAAVQAVSRAQGSEFDYGRACGIYAGLTRAMELLMNAYDDKEARDAAL